MSKNKFELQEPRKGWYRAEIKDPLTGKNLVFQGADPVIVATRRDEIRRVTAQLRAGLVSPEEARAQRARATGGVVTLERVVTTYLETVSSASLRPFGSAWRNRLRRQLGHLAIVELTKSTMEKWERDELAAGKSPKTVANAFAIARSAVNLAIADGLVVKVPWADFAVRAPREEHLEAEITRTIEELRALVAAARSHDEQEMSRNRGCRWSCLWIKIVVGTYLALRQGELAALGWDDLRLRGGPSIVIRHQVVRGWKELHPEWDRPTAQVKGRRECVLPLPPDVLLALAVQKRALEKLGHYRPSGPIFPTRGGEWRGHPEAIDGPTFKRIFLAAMPDARHENVYPHVLRHGGATLILHALGGDLGRAKRLTRHRTTRMFEVYLHAATRETAHPMPSVFRLELPTLPSAVEVLDAPLLPPSFDAPRLDRPLRLVEAIDASVEEALQILTAASEDASDKRLEPVDDLMLRVDERADRERREARRRARKSRCKKAQREPLDMVKIYDAWCASGRPGDIPDTVAEEANRAYARAYVAAKRADKLVRWHVSRAHATWSALARKLLNGDEPTGEQLAAIRAANPGDKPPIAGDVLTLPPEIHAIRKGRRARRALIGAWFRVVKQRDQSERASALHDPSFDSISS